MHEYGHVLDSRRIGLGYLYDIGIKSLISAANSHPLGDCRTTHSLYWTEMRANRKAKGYFSKFYGVDWDAKMEYFNIKRTIEFFYPTRK